MPQTPSPCFIVCNVLCVSVRAEENLKTSRRFCENNPDPNFASCSQPQELSDDEIDKQLVGSEVRKSLVCSHLGAELSLAEFIHTGSFRAAATLEHRCALIIIRRAAGLTW